MADKLEGDATDGQSRTAKPKPAAAEAPPAQSPSEKPNLQRSPTISPANFCASVTSSTAHRTTRRQLCGSNLTGSRPATSTPFPTSSGSPRPMVGRRSRSTAATSSGRQLSLPPPRKGLAVENYSPSKVVQAEAERLRARIAEREERRDKKKSGTTKPQTDDELTKLKALSERFLNQSHAENARDPELRRAQSLVAQTISIARAKYPDDPVKASKDVEARRQEVAIRIANGDKIAIIQVRNQQAQRVREVTQEQVLQRDGRLR